MASKLTSIAKSLVKVAKHEMQEIENCPDCYLNAHAKKDSWFVSACVSNFFISFSLLLFHPSRKINPLLYFYW